MTAERPSVFPADQIPPIAVASMHQTHLEEVELINRLGRALQADATEQSRVQIDAALNEWLAHTREHFERENRLMQEHGFFAYDMHAGEHERALQQLSELVAAWHRDGNRSVVEQFIFKQWPQWSTEHVSSMDHVTAQFLQQQGVA